MLTVILAESELEMIPESIRSHPSIVSSAKKQNKKPGEMLLDSNYHHKAMENLSEGSRRGRPDIVHVFLLTVLESIANIEDKLKVVVHTRNDEVIYVDSETRLMRNYGRFLGLIEQLFKKRKVPSEKKTLLKLQEDKNINKLVEEEKGDFNIAFSPYGKQRSLSRYFESLKGECEDVLCLIGGFPEGDFHFDESKIVDDVVSIYDKELVAWTVASEVLVNYENVFL